MTAASLAVFVGCTGTLHVSTTGGELAVRVEIIDARTKWGRTDYLVTPVAGSGQQWVDAARVDDLNTPSVTP